MNSSLFKKFEVEEESLESATLRYEGFGDKIFIKIKEELPEVFYKLKFYQPVTQSEDVVALYNDSERPFVIQLNLLCGVICIWDEITEIEIGHWSKNEYAESIEYIKTKIY